MTDDDTILTPSRRPVQRCGAYELVREVGRGGMGSVWEARHVSLGRRAAVKVLHADFVGNPELLARLLLEGEAAARIEHPHVASVIDVGQDDDRAWLVMEFLDGEDLGALLERETRLDATRAVDLMLPVLAAVATAHAAGVVHRDLKPGNVFLARDGSGAVLPKVVDFGFSKIQPGESADDMELTRPDTALGTLSYMPVEQVRSSRTATAACDQYALGVTLYRCLTGRLPFAERTNAATFAAIVRGACPRPRELMPSIPEALDAAILRAMHRTPEGRFTSVLAFGAALVPFASPAVAQRWAPTFGVAPAAPWVAPAAVEARVAPSAPAAPPRATSYRALAVVIPVVALAGALGAWLATR